ncbi:hypothetical protein PN498_24495 [Oscillatoria sp. CS-180]|uniref:hypothetical protein n=1 Tax=Oscillatoria sp. CS-180 TaxID=3021720 RepID=UPI00232E0C3D|nr:hypothetical protein [Oscillatoria sp. CS-180]MDB9529175.1 hypothetical protein [Oscillatoria sp. CS-180]
MTIRRILGFTWFYLLAFITATIIISMEVDVGGLVNALSFPTVLATVLLALLIGLAAVPSLFLFRRQRWASGVLVALGAGVAVWGVLLMLQTTTASLTLRETLQLLPQAILISGGWTLLVSFPAALFLSNHQ